MPASSLTPLPPPSPLPSAHPRARQSAKRVLSQLKRIARALWSNPPTHGARIAAEVVGDPAMFEEWKAEMMGELFTPCQLACLLCWFPCTHASPAHGGPLTQAPSGPRRAVRAALRLLALHTCPSASLSRRPPPLFDAAHPSPQRHPPTHPPNPQPPHPPGMAGRIAKVRGELQSALEKRMPDKDWSFITKQIGMFR